MTDLSFDEAARAARRAENVVDERQPITKAAGVNPVAHHRRGNVNHFQWRVALFEGFFL